MDLDKAYDRVDWLALWDVLKIYGVGGKLLNAIKSFYEEASACVKVSGETSEHFDTCRCLLVERLYCTKQFSSHTIYL